MPKPSLMQLHGDPHVHDAINSLCRMCTDNRDWYYGYMNCNEPRIVGDTNFIATRVAQSARVLDIGAMPPLFVELLRRNGFPSCSVADPHPEPFAEYFRASGIKAYKVNLLEGAPPDFVGRYDLVCLNEVIEHLAGNLLVAIQSALNCLSPGGYLMVTTPNLRSIWGLIALLAGSSGLASKPYDCVRAQYDRESAQFGYYGHVREYTKKEIVELFRSFGMELHDCQFQRNYLPLGGFTRPAGMLERVLPSWRLFAKYLFVRSTE